MIKISAQLLRHYSTFIDRRRGVQSSLRQYYVKWLRYYLDFCHKYNLPLDAEKSRVAFAVKVKDKKQSEKQRKQAGHAVSLYCEMNFSTKKQASGNSSNGKGAVESKDLFNTQSFHTKQIACYQENQPDDSSFIQRVCSGPTPD